MSRAGGGYRPDKSPAVGVKHRQRPEITIGTGHGLMEQRADGVHLGVAVRDHHALRARGRAAGVIDRQQIGLANVWADKVSRARAEQRFIIQPVLSLLPVSATKCSTLGKLGANAVDGLEIIAVCANDARAAVIDEVNEIVRGQAIVNRHQHRADLRHGIERFELRVGVRRDIGDAVARANPKLLQGRRPTIAPIEKLRVGPARSPSITAVVPDRLCARGERIREALAAFPCLVEKYHEPGSLVCGRAPILSTNNAGRLHSHAARSELVVGIATTGWQRRGRAATMRNDDCATR